MINVSALIEIQSAWDVYKESTQQARKVLEQAEEAVEMAKEVRGQAEKAFGEAAEQAFDIYKAELDKILEEHKCQGKPK